ncbi:MAG TPA: two-component regulator propeller domain-containing protein [Bacteroidales bacterium]|nr:two-component regulator propeller domain-containing protein [Bacteroidales bacterium]
MKKHILRFTFVFFLTGLLTSSGFGQVQSFGAGITAKKFHAATVDGNNVVWFLSDAGIVSFDGAKWNLHNANSKVPQNELKAISNDLSDGNVLWIATPKGATAAKAPVDANAEATTYVATNSKLLSENILSLVVGKPGLRWFGTDKGIFAFDKAKWLDNTYLDKYPEDLFVDYPITSMATSPDGDSLYAGTIGGGVFRVYKNEVDGISGASEYAEWGPIIMPSDDVYCVHIASDGTQWIGTDKGIAKHKGGNTLEGWTVYAKADGLVDDFVQAISSDKKGNIYFGTKAGLSVFNGTTWTSYKTDSGLASDNILSIVTDKNDSVWIGTDNGISCFKGGKFTTYR